MVERQTPDQKDPGSSPASGNNYFLYKVQRDLIRQRVSSKASDLHTWKYSVHLQKAEAMMGWAEPSANRINHPPYYVNNVDD